MKELGSFDTDNGNTYEGFFYEEDNLVEVCGPMIPQNFVANSECRKFVKTATSKEEARQIIKDAIREKILK